MTAAGRVLFLIPARGGSRRVPGKNLRLVGGIPLVGWAARIGRAAARSLGGDGHLVICSTDDAAISGAASAWGAAVLERPAQLAGDDASSSQVARHAIEALASRGQSFDALVLLQPSSPLTDPADVVAAIERHAAAGGASVTSVVAGHPASWHHLVGPDGALQSSVGSPPAGSADAADARLAGAFYVVGVAEFLASGRFVEPGRTIAFEIPAARAVDVDEEVDLVLAEALLGARAVRPVPVGEATIGPGRTFVIAEAGVNHNGDPELARRLVDAAAETGADAVKFQTFDPASLAARGAPMAAYQRAAGVEADDQRDMLAALALPRETWVDLQAHATRLGLVFISTPFDDPSADILDALGVPAFKVGSGELTNTPFLARLARRGRPMLVSTGMADMIEVAEAVDTVIANGDVPVALLHCVSSYPAAPADANLRAMETLRRAFGVPVGWSDHTDGIDLPLAAVALGASLVEKHLTLDRGLPGPDHRASLEPGEFRDMVSGIRRVEEGLGSGVKRPTPSERDVASVARRSLYWRASRPAGHVVVEADVQVLRPAAGMPPSALRLVVGRRTARAVEGGQLVSPADVDER